MVMIVDVASNNVSNVIAVYNAVFILLSPLFSGIFENYFHSVFLLVTPIAEQSPFLASTFHSPSGL
jgi:hypothetical protein